MIVTALNLGILTGTIILIFRIGMKVLKFVIIKKKEIVKEIQMPAFGLPVWILN